MKSKPPVTPLQAAPLLLLALALAGCSTTSSDESVDYRSGGAKTAQLDIPPDLTQLAREGRYQPQASVVSANSMRQAAATSPTVPTNPTVVAPIAVGDLRIDRQGNERWLVTPMPPEQLYPLVRSFWMERGFLMDMDNPDIGVMETDWAENRAVIKQDIIRATLGKYLDTLYSTAQRDRFRTRIERGPNGSEVYITHRGIQEVYVTEMKDQTRWQPRPSEPELEAEFLMRLMVKLGSKEDVARTTVANAPIEAAKQPSKNPLSRGPALPATAAMEIDQGFERAWRQVGVALDRSGFTIEDRDRGAGLYFVRYVDAKQAAANEPGFFSKMFSSDNPAARPQRLRVVVKGNGPKTQVSVQTAEGAVDNSEQARTIIAKLIDELK